MTDKFVVLVTCKTTAEARRIAHAVVDEKLAACVNILPGAVESIYRWKGKVETARERLLLIKTSRKRLAKLQAMVLGHPLLRCPRVFGDSNRGGISRLSGVAR